MIVIGTEIEGLSEQQSRPSNLTLQFRKYLFSMNEESVAGGMCYNKNISSGDRGLLFFFTEEMQAVSLVSAPKLSCIACGACFIGSRAAIPDLS